MIYHLKLITYHIKNYLLFGLLAVTVNGFGQSSEGVLTGKRYPAAVIDGDTMPLIRLPDVVVYPQRILGNDKVSKQYTSLAKKVLKTYPYARLAVKILTEINDTLSKIEKESEQKRIVKEYEKRLFAEYKADLVNMTISEGRILIKLIDRETGKTSFKLIETMRGKPSAIFWQTLAKLFGETLKVEYNPLGEDRMIEEIVIKIEQGRLEPFPLSKRKKG